MWRVLCCTQPDTCTTTDNGREDKRVLCGQTPIDTTSWTLLNHGKPDMSVNTNLCFTEITLSLWNLAGKKIIKRLIILGNTPNIKKKHKTGISYSKLKPILSKLIQLMSYILHCAYNKLLKINGQIYCFSAA